MANEKISQMPAISSFATGDLLPIVDVSEISTSDQNKSVTFGELFRNVLGGSASAPSIAFTGDQNTGIYSPGADQVAVATNGTGRLFVDASGNVGVGVSSPQRRLHVVGDDGPVSSSPTLGAKDFLVVENNGNSNLSLVSGAAAALKFFTSGSSTPDGQIVYDFSNDNLALVSAGTINFSIAANERARLDSSGRLLVGTSNSTDNARFNSKISVVGTGAAQLPGVIVNGYTGTTNAGDAPFIDLGRSRGTTDGSYTEVVSNDYLGYIVFRGADGVGWSDAATISAQADGDWTTSGDTTDSPGRLVFSTTADGASSPTPRAAINSAGDLLIGGTIPTAPNTTLTESGNIRANGYVYGKSQFHAETIQASEARTYTITFPTSVRSPYLLFIGYGTGAASTSSRFSTVLGVYNPVTVGTGTWQVISANGASTATYGVVTATAGADGVLTVEKSAGGASAGIRMTISIVNGGDLAWSSLVAS